MEAASKNVSKDIENRAGPALSIVYHNIDQLAVDLENPRLHSKRQIQQIARSIEVFGFNVPFLIDHNQRLIAGHGRLAACKLLNIRRVPTICLEHLTKPQVRAFMIADNRLAETATWNDHLLAEQFKSLSEVKLDFSLEATGFEVGEIDVMIEGLTPAPAGEEDSADELPNIDAVLRVTRVGDLWLLGRHRLICGDALDEQSYSSLMEQHHAAAVFTDPPYNDPIDGYVTGFGKVHHPAFPMASGEMTEAEFTEFLSKVLFHLARASAVGSLQFICMDWRHMKELLAAGENAYSELKNVCVWVKDKGGQGSLYRSQHELVFVFKSGKGKHRNNIQLGQFGRYRTNVWQYPRVNSVSNKGEEGNLIELHPTIKPVAMVTEAILDVTARGEIVLDAFVGSGTTLMAAERAGRVGTGLSSIQSMWTWPSVAGKPIPVKRRSTRQPDVPSMKRRRCGMAKEGKDKQAGEYPVGYRKPPAHSRFEKGVSGNPSGRPKGTLNLPSVLQKTLRERVVINENGRRTIITKLEAFVKQLVNKAASGDLRAVSQLVGITLTVEQSAAEEMPPNEVLNALDTKVMFKILERYHQSMKEG